MIQALRAFTRPIWRRILLLLSRGVVRLVDDGPGLQAIQVDLLKGEVRDELERFQDYGFTSVPHAGAEVLAGFLGGSRDHGVILAAADRRYRVKGLTAGEVAIYTDEGDVIHFKRGREILVLAGGLVRMQAPMVRIEGNLVVTGDVTDRDGQSDSTTMRFIRSRFNAHVHENPEGGNVGPANPQFPT